MNNKDSLKKGKPFYITTTLPYVNSAPHIGFAMEIIRADIIARWKRSEGFDVFFNTGTDEHGAKIDRKAKEEEKETKNYVDEYAKKFKDLKGLLNLYPEIHFIRTTDEQHKQSAQEFWRRCLANGDIYKKNYKIKYCVGCELEKTESEIVDGKCSIHTNLVLEIIDEENYFFKFSKYQKPLLEFYKNNPKFVIPETRFNEIKSFVERGLEDFSVSRLKEKMSWGVPVPDDESHVMYVWFDALVSYISTLGWPQNSEQFERFWANGSPVQYAGKDNLRQQSAMWQAMLMSAGLPNSNTIVINGFINSGGVKMSKSLGNVIDPSAIVTEYGVDALRYHVAREFSTFEDSDFTMEKFKESYNANLANGLGNLVSRIMKMAESHLVGPPTLVESKSSDMFTFALENFEIQKATNIIWQKIGDLDQQIQETEPFKLIKEDKDKGIQVISGLVSSLYEIAVLLGPFLPDASCKIKELIKDNKAPTTPLFVRKD